MQEKDRKIFLIKNETNETVGTFFSISKEKLKQYIKDKNLYPKTKITIEEFINNDLDSDVVPLLYTERFLWYELKHRHCVHIVK
ncbi:MAG: hypothetical protein U9Q33_10510 [Campylobacterota bacterium]|nr:hypothetical protein [Campylobacterota bacterium]